MSIKDLAERIRSREVTSAEVTEVILERIKRMDSKLKSFITVTGEEARMEAKIADDEIRAGKYRGPLHGVPVAVKDVIAARDTPTTAASKVLAENVTDYDAESVARMKNAGCVFLGKLNMHEFAYGGSGEESYYGAIRNPWNPEYISGGSSSGSAAAVAAGICQGALGTDTGGSIRIPSNFCGVVGLKPTYGRVSRHGVIPVSWALDHVGPVTRTVEDAAVMLEIISGPDPKDTTCSRRPVPNFFQKLTKNVKGLRAAILKRYFDDCVNLEVRRNVEKAVSILESMGVKTEDIQIPNIEHTAVTTNILMACEATTYHEKWLKTRPEDYSPMVRTRLEVGYFYMATHYIKALKLREWFKRIFSKALKNNDVILSPSCPISPFKIDQKTINVNGKDVDPRPYIAMCTRVHDLTGFPAMSIPCGFTSDGFPIGLQISGRPFDEETVLRTAFAYEQSQSWRERHPQL